MKMGIVIDIVPDAECYSTKWPDCVVTGKNYPGSDTSDSPIGPVSSNAECADVCQARSDCQLWLLQGTNCWLKWTADLTPVDNPTILGAGTRRECYYQWLEASTVMQP